MVEMPTAGRRGLLRSLGRVLNAWQFLRRWPVIPLLILIGLAVCAIFAPQLTTENPRRGRVVDRHIPPAWTEEGSTAHLLGTDHVGRDVYTRIIHGARISMMVALIALTSGFILGTSIGVVSGYAGGWLDEVLMRIVDVWMSIPFLMVALVLVIVIGQSMATLMGLLAMLAWVHFVRVIRGQTLQLKEMDYIALARVAGASSLRVMFRHLFPGIVNTAVVIATLRVGQLIMAEATLSFLGAGIPPPTPAWGVMVGEARGYLEAAWWTSVFPGICIFLTVMALNFFGDWLRDRLDPRLRQL